VILKRRSPALGELVSERESRVLDQKRGSRVLKKAERGTRILDQKHRSRIGHGPRIF